MKILFVCTGNICRSPTAEGVLRARLTARGLGHVAVDSAGTHSYHVGEAPDVRSIRAAKKRGVSIENQRARKVTPQDFYAFDLLLACDDGHLDILQRAKPKDATATVALFLDYAGVGGQVPDPYYGDATGFEQVLDLCEAGAEGVIEKLPPTHHKKHWKY
ncbi:MAG: low molecular weight phosphotyrosine protein phosphatase [Alphaproteobacteria bacterium]|nr:low molecular weight phosphotyrosine protein phosphatase [Alphaproteobacteria bacterium]